MASTSPSSMKTWIIAGLCLLCVAQGTAIYFLSQRSRAQEVALVEPVQRGQRIAEQMGCFGCHGPGGVRPIANPGARYGEVPNWGDGTWMLWNRNEADVRAWITDGHPPMRGPDREALLPMPAYGRLLSDEDLDDLVAYVLAVSRFGELDDSAAAEGREVANRLGCFGCHGPEGRGLVWNPTSFRGYIPPWDSEDYLELVQTDDEFREWVRDGISHRLRDNPVARKFLESRPIRMPAYGDHVTDEELDSMLAYVKWMRANPRGSRREP